MRDVHERTLLYLGVALRNPGRKALSVQVWMPAQSGVHGVDDEVEEIGLICSVAVGASKNHPVGAASGEHFHTGGLEMSKEMSPGATVPGRFASNQAAIHGLVIACLNGHIELQVDLRLEDRATVKGDGAVQEPARPQEGEERRQSRGHITRSSKACAMSRSQVRWPCSRAMKRNKSMASVATLMSCPGRCIWSCA